MKSTKARNFVKSLEKDYNAHNKMINSTVAWQAVELAELELKDKAQKAFCRQQCKIVCWESDYNNRCPDFEKFVAELDL
ncbi:MAG: hypothetical protein ACLU6Z_02645 [Odoribacter splanchnicus]|jgi:hypothetical protein|nr:MAG TPA: hypothetical protein [Caudoviricetes sp.]